MASLRPSREQATAFVLLIALALTVTAGLLVLPGPVFLVALGIACVLGFGLLKSEYALFLVILTVGIDMVALAVQVKGRIQGLNAFVVEPRFFVFYAPLFVGIITWLAARAVGKQPRREPTPLDGLLTLIVLYECLSVLWGADVLYNASSAANLVVNLLLFFFVTAVIRDRATLDRAARVWVAAGTLGAIGVFASQYIDVNTQIELSPRINLLLAFGKLGNRPSGFAGHNHIAGFCGMALAIAAGVLWQEKRRSRVVLYTLCALLMLASIILTESRAALVGVLVSGPFFIFLHPRLRRRPMAACLTFLLIVVAVLFITRPSLIDRIMLGLGYTGKLYFTAEDAYFGGTGVVAGGVNAASRKLWWINGFEEMVLHPWKLVLGLGVGGFSYFSQGSPDTNNTLLWFFYDMGLFGIIMLILFLRLFIGTVRRHLVCGAQTASYALFAAALTAFVLEPGIHGLLELDWSMGGSRLVWFPLSFVMAAANVLRADAAWRPDAIASPRPEKTGGQGADDGAQTI